MDDRMIVFIGSVLTLLGIYLVSGSVRGWVKRLNEYDPILQQPKVSSSLRWSAFLLFWLVSVAVFLLGRSILGVILNKDSWVFWLNL